jgi:putative ABC transport system ATP-binding protein
MDSPKKPSLVATRLHRGFGAGPLRQEIIRGVSLEAHPGELTIIIGPSGSGKTTLLGLLSGLLKPNSGQVKCLGSDLESLDAPGLERFRLRNSGFIFQGFNLFSPLTAIEQVMLPLRYTEESDAGFLEAARIALAEVGLSGKENLRPKELSGGEKQRVAIARAIAKAPKLLFADEPTSALDSANAERVVALFQQLAHRLDSTILCVTHDERLLRFADHVLHLRDGVIVEDSIPTAS